MKRLRHQLLRVAGAVLGAIGAVILLEVVVSALGSGSHPIANWAVNKLDKVFRPVGRWFVGAPDWAWIAVIMVLGFPAAILLTWALDEAGIGIKRQYKPRWVVGIWIIAVTLACASIRWARSSHGF
ncbi:MAG: hypothetical protein NT105_24020 [Verrucomicrobia bacterium]|nr:hypothetical protein [Verrucomicrobiota bacterium]